jgi:hypothetical protein
MLFLEDEKIFQNRLLSTLVRCGVEFPMEPSWPIFEKCFHLREKGGVQIFFPGLYGGLYSAITLRFSDGPYESNFLKLACTLTFYGL